MHPVVKRKTHSNVQGPQVCRSDEYSTIVYKCASAYFENAHKNKRKMPLLHINKRVLLFFSAMDFGFGSPVSSFSFGRQEPQHGLYHYVVETGASGHTFTP